MRLVAKTVVSANRERVKALKSGAVRSHTEDRTALCVAAQGNTTIEKTPNSDQRPAWPCAIGPTESVQNPQSGTRTVTGGAAGEEYQRQRHTRRSESEEFRASVA